MNGELGPEPTTELWHRQSDVPVSIETCSLVGDLNGFGEAIVVMGVIARTGRSLKRHQMALTIAMSPWDQVIRRAVALFPDGGITKVAPNTLPGNVVDVAQSKVRDNLYLLGKPPSRR